jgi:lipopolysaccharide biosynthesis protein
MTPSRNTPLIAFYLPQFHPIPENDAWWGKGFTEWTNVAKARPLFKGHYQPHLPTDLGFYDLRLPEAREAQAALARGYGIHGFCYYHYWFNGRQVLERPFQEVLSSGKPDFPFCLCWANENWTRRWDGLDQEILLKQQYSTEDDRRHIQALAPALRDARCIRVHGRPVFMVYRASRLPDPLRTTTVWREEAKRMGIGELHLCNVESFHSEQGIALKFGFDAAVEFAPDWTCLGRPLGRKFICRVAAKLGLTAKDSLWNGVFEYHQTVQNMLAKTVSDYVRYPCVTPSWDNTARRSKGATVLQGACPEAYERWLCEVLHRVKARGAQEPLVFINAWNEWGEGNHLEPCSRWGRGFLEATLRALQAHHEST